MLRLGAPSHRQALQCGKGNIQPLSKHNSWFMHNAVNGYESYFLSWHENSSL
jgi:hypothetical protein